MTLNERISACPGVPEQPALVHKTWGCSNCNPIVFGSAEEGTPTGQKYPCGLGVYCDSCGTEFRGDFIVVDTMSKAERLEVVRDHVRTALRWQCDSTGDYCPDCRTDSTAQPETTHQGPHPDHGGLTTHVGTRENCSGPDCGPPDPEEEIREAVLDLEALHTAAYGNTWRIAREQEDTHPESDGSLRPIGIEPTDDDADIVVFQADDIAEEDAAYIAAMDPETGRLLANLLHEIAEDMTSSTLTPVQEAARKLANKINNRP
ncbi:hypothetical protein [Streptomyces sp. NPDC059651]|uniref:hypothetical protein n=1 Tax=Streptomyces sp. NPDC059651 TaxID=3346897 RepID=UPI0036AF10C1